MNPIEKFNLECKQEVERQAKDELLTTLSKQWIKRANELKYSYHFSWMGRPIIQYPTDIIALQEVIYETRPKYIIETGIAHGGSVIFHASQLALLDMIDPLPNGTKRHVYAVDVDIRAHNLEQLEAHPLSDYFTLYEGSSTSEVVIKEISDDINNMFGNTDSGMVVLDSNHTHVHVLNELRAYQNFVGKNNYMVVFDTIIEFLEDAEWPNRDWCKGNNPYTATVEFLSENESFEVDHTIDDKIMFGVGPFGYLRRTK